MKLFFAGFSSFSFRMQAQNRILPVTCSSKLKISHYPSTPFEMIAGVNMILARSSSLSQLPSLQATWRNCCLTYSAVLPL
jgi:D-mannonate dehydratase